MWAELIAPLLLLLGLGTRFAAFVLMILTVVAIAAVHWPAHWSSLAELAQGYSISDRGYGNYKLPLIYLVAALPCSSTAPDASASTPCCAAGAEFFRPMSPRIRRCAGFFFEMMGLATLAERRP